MAALAALLLVLFSPSASGVAGGGGARGWLSRVRGFAARRLPSRRALSLSAQSCDCVTLGWDANAAAAFSTSSPAGTRAAAVLPAGCLEGLQADCAAGRLNATECELQALDESLLGLTFIRYFPSEEIINWLVAASSQCDAPQLINDESAAAILRLPLQAPTLFSPETAAFFLLLYAKTVGLPPTAKDTFYDNHITGAQWAAFELSDYEDLGFTKGQAFSTHTIFQDYLNELSTAGQFDLGQPAGFRIGPTQLYVQVILERLIEVQAPNFFEVEYYVNFAWEDNRIFSRCISLTEDDMEPSDPCSYYWKPKVLLPDALLGDEEPQMVQDLGFTTHVGEDQNDSGDNAIAGLKQSLAYLQYRQRAKFLVSLDYNMLPFDKHTLNFTMRLPSTDTSDKACFVTGLRNSTVVELPDLQLGAGWEDGDKPLIWDGLPEQVSRSSRPANQLWDILDFTANPSRSPKDPLFELKSSDWSNQNNPALALREHLNNNLPEVMEAFIAGGEYTVCQVTFSITIARRNLYHIFNYIIMQFVLVILGWCTFFIDPSSVDARLGISLTLLLAINVFQIVLVDKMPETGSLSRLQWFTILNTILLALMAIESIIVCQCHQSELYRKELDARLKEVRARQPYPAIPAP